MRQYSYIREQSDVYRSVYIYREMEKNKYIVCHNITVQSGMQRPPMGCYNQFSQLFGVLVLRGYYSCRVFCRSQDQDNLLNGINSEKIPQPQLLGTRWIGGMWNIRLNTAQVQYLYALVYNDNSSISDQSLLVQKHYD